MNQSVFNLTDDKFGIDRIGQDAIHTATEFSNSSVHRDQLTGPSCQIACRQTGNDNAEIVLNLPPRQVVSFLERKKTGGSSSRTSNRVIGSRKMEAVSR